jgi:hypothetical protein
MDTVGNLCGELDKLLSDVTASGYGNLDAGVGEKLAQLSSAADGLGMKNGKKLIDNFADVLKSFKDGKADEKSVSLRFTALDFYKNNIKANQGELEEL